LPPWPRWRSGATVPCSGSHSTGPKRSTR
jgi:hypothetical protein